MFQNVTPLFRCFDHQFQAFTNPSLTLKLTKEWGAQGEIKGALGRLNCFLVKIFRHNELVFRCLNTP
jgi:hypothetical protein